MRLRLLAIAVTLLCAQEAGAQVRTFVASNGLDSNPCTRTEPCRNFGPAVLAVVPGGEVVALDSAGYGPFTIAKSVQIIAPEGVYAAIAPTSPDPSITIAAGATRVVLQNIALVSRGSLYGVFIAVDARVHISGCTFSDYDTSIANDDGSSIYLSDSVIWNSDFGVELDGETEPTLFAIEHTRFEEISGIALRVTGFGKGTIAHSSLHGVGVGIGVEASSTSPRVATVVVESCVITQFGIALDVGFGASPTGQIDVAGSTLAFNDLVWGTGVSTRGNNTVTRNIQAVPVIPIFNSR